MESSCSSEDGDDREERDRYDGMGLVGKVAALVVVLGEEDVERVDESVDTSDINSSSTWPLSPLRASWRILSDRDLADV